MLRFIILYTICESVREGKWRKQR